MMNRGNQIQITTTENGFIVTLPVRYKRVPVIHRRGIGAVSDPVLESLKEKGPETELKPEPFKFQVNSGVYVFTSYEKVLEFLTKLKDSETVREGGMGGDAVAFDDGYDFE